MKQENKKFLNPISALLIMSFSCAAFAASENECGTIEKNATPSSVPTDGDQLQELKERLVASQVYLLDENVSGASDNDVKRSKVCSKREHKISRKTVKFLKSNALNICSLVCTIIGVYISYKSGKESLKFTRASFALDRGATALENIHLSENGNYRQYKTVVDSGKQQSAA